MLNLKKKDKTTWPILLEILSMKLLPSLSDQNCRYTCDKEGSLTTNLSFADWGLFRSPNKHANGISSFEPHFSATVITQTNLTAELSSVRRSVYFGSFLQSARKCLNVILLSIIDFPISLSLHSIIKVSRVGSLAYPENRNSIPEPTYRGTVSNNTRPRSFSVEDSAPNSHTGSKDQEERSQ